MDNPNYSIYDDNNSNGTSPIYDDKRSNSMALASLVLGIIAIATGCCVYTSIICGALAIMLALLSRGGEMTMAPRAKVGMILGIIGIVLGILMLVAAIAFVIIQFGGFENYMDSYMEYYNGIMNGNPSIYQYPYPDTL